MQPLQVVIDTNVIVSAIRSKRGASYRLLLGLGADARWQINLSTALMLEYEAKVREHGLTLGYTDAQLDVFLDHVCAAAQERLIHFRWRPFLRDAGDDFVLELAVAAGADCIITHNVSDFAGAHQFGIGVLTPKEFLREIGEIQ
jgi:putative PIN family toxin of toxin-antitoxin system